MTEADLAGLLEGADGGNITAATTNGATEMTASGAAAYADMTLTGGAAASVDYAAATTDYAAATTDYVAASTDYVAASTDYAAASADYDAGTATVVVADMSVASLTDAQSTIASVDEAIAEVDTIRAGLGAVQNRFESTISNLMNVSENISAARSRIMDADFAAETADMTKSQILQQAGMAMLSQANSIPQGALSLLQ
ncbi:MAG: flagellin [Desulfurivibrionaceae bacterium]|nr:flagellin [Desulfurivibrionaceae bacterium]